MVINRVFRNIYFQVLVLIVFVIILAVPRVKRYTEELEYKKKVEILEQKKKDELYEIEIKREAARKEQEKKIQESLQKIKEEFDVNNNSKIEKSTNKLRVKSGDSVKLKVAYFIDNEAFPIQITEFAITQNSKTHYLLEKNILNKQVGYIFEMPILEYVNDKYFKKQYEDMKKQFNKDIKNNEQLKNEPYLRDFDIDAAFNEINLTLKFKISDIQHTTVKTNNNTGKKTNNNVASDKKDNSSTNNTKK